MYLQMKLDNVPAAVTSELQSCGKVRECCGERWTAVCRQSQFNTLTHLAYFAVSSDIGGADLCPSTRFFDRFTNASGRHCCAARFCQPPCEQQQCATGDGQPWTHRACSWWPCLTYRRCTGRGRCMCHSHSARQCSGRCPWPHTLLAYLDSLGPQAAICILPLHAPATAREGRGRAGEAAAGAAREGMGRSSGSARPCWADTGCRDALPCRRRVLGIILCPSLPQLRATLRRSPALCPCCSGNTWCRPAGWG